jgi:hypothetical protein
MRSSRGRGEGPSAEVHSNTPCCPARMARLASHAAAATCALLVVALAPRVVGDDTTSRFTFKVCISLPTHTCVHVCLGLAGSVCEAKCQPMGAESASCLPLPSSMISATANAVHLMPTRFNGPQACFIVGAPRSTVARQHTLVFKLLLRAHS